MSQYHQCRSFAGLSLTYPVCRLDELLQFRGGVMGSDVAIAMAKQYFPRLQRHTCGPQSTAECVLEIMHSHRQIQSPSAALPGTVVDVLHRSRFIGEYKIPMLAANTVHDGLGNAIQYHQSILPVFYPLSWDKKNGCLQFRYPYFPIPTKLADFLIPTPRIHLE